jgi:hypothetical protein
MYKKAMFAVSMMMAMVVALTFFVQPGWATGEKFVEEFKAVISKDTIKVGESAVVTLSGGQLESIWASKDLPFDWSKLCSVTRIDKTKFKVKGLAPGNAVITFKNSDRKAVVKVTVVVGGLN